MADAATPVTEASFTVIDSLVANEFSIEIDGAVVMGVFRVSGLTTFKLDSSGQRVLPPVWIAKMVQRDGRNAFNTWLRQTLAGASAERPTRRVTIVAVDDGVAIRRWTLVNTRIQEISYSDFDSASGEMVEERILVTYDSIEESYPATPGL